MYSLTLLRVEDSFLDKDGNAYKILRKTVGVKEPFKGVEIVVLQPLWGIMKEGQTVLAEPVALPMDELLYQLGLREAQPVYGEPQPEPVLH